KKLGQDTAPQMTNRLLSVPLVMCGNKKRILLSGSSTLFLEHTSRCRRGEPGRRGLVPESVSSGEAEYSDSVVVRAIAIGDKSPPTGLVSIARSVFANRRNRQRQLIQACRIDAGDVGAAGVDHVHAVLMTKARHL